VGEKLSALAAHGQWQEMPSLITDDMLEKFCISAESPSEMAAALQKRYASLADRITTYLPFIPDDKDDFWRELAQVLQNFS
jgi:alkanesulfonate monooxygenase SsuD/methylene tetrahydromethanopterin reductase-like flavin-dependent oxidoreductase (luciferase family)